MRRKNHVWIMRDKRCSVFSMYKIYARKPDESLMDEYGEWIMFDLDLCPAKYEEIMPKRFHLKPGGGPIKLEFK